jgi:hypothetical protein
MSTPTPDPQRAYAGWRRVLALTLALTALPALAFDHRYADYGRLLAEHVHWSADGHASTVDYAGLRQQKAALDDVLSRWSAVTETEFQAWSRAQQMSFLINAYNGFTLQLIVDAEPGLKSIRDLGSLLRSPWKQRFFTLLGERRHLDWVEHEKLRVDYPDARIHFAVNCASIGCPALRPEPFTADQLEAQMDDSTERFFKDRSRNRFDAGSGTLRVSKLLDWYAEDFTVDGRADPKAWLQARADWLSEDAAERERIRRGDFRLDFLDYDWALNAQR